MSLESSYLQHSSSSLLSYKNRLCHFTYLQSLRFFVIRRNDQLSDFLVGNLLLVAVFVCQMQAFDAELRFEASRLVVDPSMDDTAAEKCTFK